MSTRFCYSCEEDRLVDTDGAQTVCTACGMVLEDNAIVSEITFGEAGSGAAVVQGSYIGADQSYRGRGGGQESRRNEINRLAHSLRLPERLADAGLRYFNLAVNMNFTKGRRTTMDKTSHMLIDFSDPLAINVFVLGSTYLKLVRELSLQLPVVDPSLYISRFASMLDFGEETQKVAQDAVRLVARMGRDWMHIGRRPAGICGACLLLAARMNNFRRSVAEIVQVVKIADQTLRKRLKEFRETPSSTLSVTAFRTLWLDETADPPAFTKNKKANEEPTGLRRVRKAAATGGDKSVGTGPEKDAAAGEDQSLAVDLAVPSSDADQQEDAEHGERLDDLNALADAAEEAASRQSMPPPPVPSAKSLGKRKRVSLFKADDNEQSDPEDTEHDDDAQESDDDDEAHLDAPALDDAIREEMNETLEGADGQALTHELDEADAKRQAEVLQRNALYNSQPLDSSTRLDDLDEEELDAFILTPEEVEAKSRLWMEFNKDYLKQLADKQTGPDGELKPVTARRPRKKIKPRDSSTPQGVSAADATKQLLTKKKFSKKINYSAIEDLFGRDSAASSVAGSDDENEDPAQSRSRRSASVSSRASQRINYPTPTFRGRSRAQSRASSIAPSLPPTPSMNSRHLGADEFEEHEEQEVPEWRRMFGRGNQDAEEETWDEL
ncbi:transcription factor TFIIIB subunit brf1 [Microbotryomycetes sp. JL201]|nr:transcription factor TFIIIB subunit brf1 [Microbotryomycetes sp. JL201]